MIVEKSKGPLPWEGGGTLGALVWKDGPVSWEEKSLDGIAHGEEMGDESQLMYG